MADNNPLRGAYLTCYCMLSYETDKLKSDKDKIKEKPCIYILLYVITS